MSSCCFFHSPQTTEHYDRPGVAARCWEIFPSQAHICFRWGWEKVPPFVKLLKCKKSHSLARVWSRKELGRVAGGGSRQRASGQQLGKLRLSYWHAGTGSRFCLETAVNQQPIAQQSGACFFRRMLMCCNLLFSAFRSQNLHLSWIGVTVLASIFSCQEQITKNILAKKVSKINLKLMPTFAKDSFVCDDRGWMSSLSQVTFMSQFV